MFAFERTPKLLQCEPPFRWINIPWRFAASFEPNLHSVIVGGIVKCKKFERAKRFRNSAIRFPAEVNIERKKEGFCSQLVIPSLFSFRTPTSITHDMSSEQKVRLGINALNSLRTELNPKQRTSVQVLSIQNSSLCRIKNSFKGKLQLLFSPKSRSEKLNFEKSWNHFQIYFFFVRISNWNIFTFFSISFHFSSLFAYLGTQKCRTRIARTTSLPAELIFYETSFLVIYCHRRPCQVGEPRREKWKFAWPLRQLDSSCHLTPNSLPTPWTKKPP